jgi:CheY-like chemotaxis protein
MAHEYIAPTPDQIAVGAYHVWEKESHPLGRQKANWFEAERQLMFTMPNSGIGRDIPRHRVLVIDDEPLATHMLGRLLRKHGYIAAEENDPAKAVEKAHRFQPDIVLLDMHMPWRDGHEVAVDFASDNTLCCVPIIFITHLALDRNKSTGSIPILVKPFSIEELFACLEKIDHRAGLKPFNR